MTSEADIIESFISAQVYLFQFGGPLLIGAGSISCILSLIVFTKKNLRKNPCSIYFMAISIVNLLIICISILIGTLRIGYNIDPTAYNLNLCRFYYYTGYLFDSLNPSYLILASIDRILITSSNAGTRRRSTRRLACIFLISVTLFWILFHSQALFFSNIIEVAPNFFICYFQLGTYLIFTSYYLIIVKGILVPLLMIILGLWAIKNVRRMRRIIPAPIVSLTGRPTAVGSHFAHSKDRQLIRIILVDIIVYIVFSAMISAALMYQQLTQYQSKNLVQVRIENFALDVGIFSYFIPFCVGCYTNLLVSKAFRNEMKNIFLCQ